MTSQDMSTIVLQLRELITVNREQIAEMKALAAQMQKDNAEFREQMKDDFNKFTEKVNARLDAFEKKTNTWLDAFEEKTNKRLDAFEAKTDSRFDKLEASVGAMQNDITGLKHDVVGLYHWDYWLLSIILMVFAMPQIVAGVKALFGAIAEGIAGIIAVFRDRGGGGA